MQSLHSPACQAYLVAAQTIPAVAAVASHLLPLPDSQIRDELITYLDEDPRTPVEAFARGLWPLLTQEVTA